MEEFGRGRVKIVIFGVTLRKSCGYAVGEVVQVVQVVQVGEVRHDWQDLQDLQSSSLRAY
jgi:hypothetical protein